MATPCDWLFEIVKLWRVEVGQQQVEASVLSIHREQL